MEETGDLRGDSPDVFVQKTAEDVDFTLLFLTNSLLTRIWRRSSCKKTTDLRVRVGSEFSRTLYGIVLKSNGEVSVGAVSTSRTKASKRSRQWFPGNFTRISISLKK